VSKALTRLHTANVLTKLPTENSRNSRNSPGYLLRAAKEVSIEETKTAGLPIDNPARAAVHPLFGAGGLGAGPADTFAMLSELSRPVLRGRLIRTRMISMALALMRTASSMMSRKARSMSVLRL
jgi:hypothetical protein